MEARALEREARGSYLQGHRKVVAALAAVWDETGVSPAALRSKERTATIAAARHFACWLLRNTTTLSYPEIGSLLGGRDHTTIMSSVRAHERAMGRDEKVAESSTFYRELLLA